MRPLLYLTGKTIVNSFRRALQSPTRLIGALMLIAWWFLVVVGNLVPPSKPPRGAIGNSLSFDLPPIQAVYAVLFAAFFLVFALRLLSLFKPPGIYRPADVDVLFPTPIPPRIVLLHRFLVDYLITLLVPIVVLIFGGRRSMEGIELLFRNMPDPEMAPLVGKTMIGAFLLLSLFAVAVCYAIGMWINRDTRLSRGLRRLFAWGYAAGAALVAALIVLAIASQEPLEALTSLANGFWMRVFLYPVAAATDLCLFPLYGTWKAGLAGGVFLVSGSIVLIRVAMAQADYLYDMVARDAAAMQSRREIQRTGDMSLAVIKAAQEGKLKPKRIGFLDRLRPRGRWAILWREAVVFTRTQLGTFMLLAVMTAGISLIMLLEEDTKGKLVLAIAPIQALMVISIAIGMSQAGFLDTLRRVDVQKPLPFSPLSMCLMEIFGKSIGPIMLVIAAASTFLVISPGDWEVAAAELIGLSSVAVVVVGVQFVVLLTFPDVDDPSQRSFRALIQFLGAALALIPSLLIFGVALFLGMPLVVSALLVALVNSVLAFLIASVASGLYAAFNPSE